MSKKEDNIKLRGTIKKCLQGAKFIVHVIENDFDVTCSLSGRMRQSKIKLYENDEVDIEVSVYDFKTGRIVWRYK